jgi:glutamyl-tRNA reductase
MQIQSDATEQVIARFRELLETAQAAELKRLYIRLPKLTDSSREEIRLFSNRLLAQFLEQPLNSLSQRANSKSPQPLLDAFQQLFQLSSNFDSALVTVSASKVEE